MINYSWHSARSSAGELLGEVPPNVTVMTLPGCSFVLQMDQALAAVLPSTFCFALFPMEMPLSTLPWRRQLVLIP